MAYKKKSKKQKRIINSAIVSVKSTFNNTVVSAATMEGDVIARSSGGCLGFKGSRKSTPFAATQIANALARDIKDMGVKKIEINLQGPGSGRDSVVRALKVSGFTITVLRDVTPLPHNGCRPPKKARN